jgi:hypothetical protein
MMIPTNASRWRGVTPVRRKGDVGVTEGRFVDAESAWAWDFFVAYPAAAEEVAGAAEKAIRLVLGEKPSWDGNWTHPAFRC